MKLIKHHSKEGVCNYIMFMESNGLAYARAYTFDNDQTTFYLDSLSVNLDFRNKGFGTTLQKEREQIAREKGYKYAMLWVKKYTWMRKWYKRRGYKYYKPYKQENAVWLRKLL